MLLNIIVLTKIEAGMAVMLCFYPMNRTVIEKALKELQPHIDQIQEPAIQGVVTGLLNLIEALATENEALQDAAIPADV